jgi:SAM-dependent methyltransferase
MQFLAHNVQLPDGSRTLADRPLLADDPACVALLRTATLLTPPAAGRRTTVLDLGCNEGGYAVEFARAGYQVLGLEARKGNVEHCEWLKEKLGLAGLEFVCADARDAAAYGTFDVVLCLGLLYHLDRPRSYLSDVLGPITRRLLLLNTHYVSPGAVQHHSLSTQATHDGASGRWYDDYPESSSASEIEGAAWASWGNPRSFWLEKPDLLAAVQEAGFATVFEQHDFIGSIRERHGAALEHGRTLLVGVKA